MKTSREIAAAALLAAACASQGALAGIEPARCIATDPNLSLDQVAAGMPQLAPAAIEWAERRQAEVLASGAVLPKQHLELARQVGVRHPERIRVAVVDRITSPEAPALRQAGSRAGLSFGTADGMTLGYAVVLRKPHAESARLLSHEFRHVAQYEACGGVAPFLAVHLAHLAKHGYDDAPFEIDARGAERERF